MRRALTFAVMLAIGIAGAGPRSVDAVESDDLVRGTSVMLRPGVLLKVGAKPAGARFSLPSAANAPTLGGGELRVFDTDGGNGVLTIPLPTQSAPYGWSVLGPVASPTGYKYRGVGTAADPCSVTLKATVLKVRCQGPGVALTPPFSGDVGVVLALGAEPKRYCARFGGVTVTNTAALLKRKGAAAPASCPVAPSPGTATSSTTTSTTLPDADGDTIPDTLDVCPGGDDRVDLDRNGHPDACDELAVRAGIDDFEGYASDAALQTTWAQWAAGGDIGVARGLGQGEGSSTAMRLTPIGADPGTGNTWASVARGVTGPATAAYDGLVFHVRHVGATSLGLGVNLTESNGEPWAPALETVELRPDGGSWVSSAAGDANGVVPLPPGFQGLVRISFAALRVPAWYGGGGNGVVDTPSLTNVSFGFSVAARLGQVVHIDAVAWWYAFDAAIAGRVTGRSWPSIYQPWNGIDDEPGVSVDDRIARHDLYWNGPWSFSLPLSTTILSEPCTPDPGGSCIGLSIAVVPSSLPAGAAYMASLRARNPNILLLAEIRYRDAWATYLPAAHRFWQRDGQGNRILGWAEGNHYLLDWHRADYRAVVAAQAAGVVAAGFDGVFLDWWDDADDDRIDLAQRVRAAIGDRILIVNSNDRQAPRTAPFINGLYMEGYQFSTPGHWQQIGATVAWADAAVRFPRVNPMETWFVTSRNDLDRMRATTTLSLTHGDGYALFCDPNDLPAPDHLHSWYAFWNEPLGAPLGPGSLQPNGSWQRAFGGGTVVYNPMGNPTVTVTFPTPRRSAATGLVATSHSVPGLDGDIFRAP